MGGNKMTEDKPIALVSEALDDLVEKGYLERRIIDGKKSYKINKKGIKYVEDMRSGKK